MWYYRLLESREKNKTDPEVRDKKLNRSQVVDSTNHETTSSGGG